MSPSLALLLCTALVLFLLRLERRGSRGVSAALWIPTIWMMIAASRPLGTWFVDSGAAGDNAAGSPLDRWVLAGLACAGIIVLARREFDWWATLRRQKWLLALLAYMCLSTLWSDITFLALKRWTRELIVIIMALVIVSEINPHRSLASLARRCAYVLLPFSVVLIKYYPAIGRQYARWSGIEMWTGATGHKNELGRLCMVSIFFLLRAIYQRWGSRSFSGERGQKWADVFIIGVGLYLLMGSSSATSLATLIFCIATFLCLRWLRKLKINVPQPALLVLVLFLIGFGASTPFVGGSNVASFTSSLGRDDTLTGRTEVWAEVVPVIKQRPLLGFGFGSFWTDERRKLYDIPTAHNGYLDVLLELGEVGLALYTAWLLSCAQQLHRALKQDYDWASFAISLLLISLIYNTTESALNSLTEYITAVVVFASLVVPIRSKIKRSAGLPMRLSFDAASLQVREGTQTQL
jgi:O-antigen ligase